VQQLTQQVVVMVEKPQQLTQVVLVELHQMEIQIEQVVRVEMDRQVE